MNGEIALFGENGFLGQALKSWCNGTQDFKSRVWINCRARVMGIGGNQKYHALLLRDNLRSALDIFNQAEFYGYPRIVNFGSTCAYSPEVDCPFRPEDYLKGEPEATNYGYAMAKRMIYTIGKTYSQQYGMDNLYLVMPNLYGPGYKVTEHMHVIPDMIRKVQEAIDSKAEEISFWGSGEAEREFLYVEDAAKLVLKAVEECHTQDPVHLTSGQMITIKALAGLICQKMGYEGTVWWDTTKPDGQLQRKLATGLELEDKISLDFGLDQTIAYYRNLTKMEKGAILSAPASP